MLKDIKIKNYKGFDCFELKDLKQLNIITGKNNSGKTTILEAIALLYNPKSAYNFSWVKSSSSIPDIVSIFFHGSNNNVPIEISTSLEKLKLEISFYEQIEEMPIKQLSFDENSENIIRKQEGLRFFYSSEKIGENGVSLNFFKTYPPYRPKMESLHISETKLTSVKNLINYAQMFDEIQTNKQDNAIINILKNTIAPKLENISLNGYGRLKVDLGYDRYLPFEVLGDGIKILFRILIAIYTTKNGIVLIDEIENGFHYSVLDSVWKVIIEAARAYNVQIFVTTHSRECIKSYMRIFNEYDDLDNNFSNYYRLERKKEEITYVEYSSEELNTALENNLETR